MHRPRASITVRGNFSHDDYSRLCEDLGSLGTLYNSMCSVESKITMAAMYLHTCSDKAAIESAVRRSLDTKVQDLSIDVEERNAEACL